VPAASLGTEARRCSTEAAPRPIRASGHLGAGVAEPRRIAARRRRKAEALGVAFYELPADIAADLERGEADAVTSARSSDL